MLDLQRYKRIHKKIDIVWAKLTAGRKVNQGYAHLHDEPLYALYKTLRVSSVNEAPVCLVYSCLTHAKYHFKQPLHLNYCNLMKQV